MLGQVAAAAVTLAGANPVIGLAVFAAGMAIPESRFSLTDDAVFGVPTWLFILLLAAVVAGYGLVLVRAIRGRRAG